MTKRSSFKKLVRERMKKTGESYSSARRQVIAAAAPQAGITHYPGINPATSALRIMLAAAGVTNPVTKQPFSEAMLLGIAGGLGAGVFTFRYEKEDFSSFFAAGRHLWHDNLEFMQACLGRLGVECKVWESSAAKKGWEQLREALAHGPVAAWLDMAELPYHGLPAWMSGGGYHVLVVQSLDEAREVAVLSDLMDEPLEVPFGDLERARLRIKKDKQRLLAVTGGGNAADLTAAIGSGLQACADGLTTGRMKNFTLAAFEDWAKQLHGSTGKSSWAVLFPAGRHLWTAQTWAYDCIEHYFSGGGMLRPLYADFLAEAGQQTGNKGLAALADTYRSIGAQWTELADTLLPAGKGLLGQARELYELRAESYNSPAEVELARSEIWQRIGELKKQASAQYPLDGSQVDSMLASAQQQLAAICIAERDALATLREVL
ncbi:MAG: DUF4872 domain-containing protein [Planctomycetales bacterium]|nr:DUF4872 domain-containing protein [bacterium]UNM06976.1 MAG: DUF4872 domain-containing protein [Planctomycetales bacterium]